jgi:hypothetical protein
MLISYTKYRNDAYNPCIGVLFFSLGHRAITVLSFVLSQKQECRICKPAPFFCMIAHDTNNSQKT